MLLSRNRIAAKAALLATTLAVATPLSKALSASAHPADHATAVRDVPSLTYQYESPLAPCTLDGPPLTDPPGDDWQIYTLGPSLSFGSDFPAWGIHLLDLEDSGEFGDDDYEDHGNNPPLGPIPSPGTLALLGFGGLTLSRRRRRQ
jgi:MYXO-CTERM domain-containing protein